MRGGLNIVLAIFMGCSLIFVAHHSILAQVKRDQEPPRAMIDRLQREIEDLKAKIASNPSSPEAGRLKKRIQWNQQQIKGILSPVAEQPKSKMKKEARGSGVERYMVIAQKNLFEPLGSGREVKRQEFVVTGILGSSTKKALIQLADQSASYYVAEGESFGNGAKLARIGGNSVTIIHEGNRVELELGKGTNAGQSRQAKGQGSGQRGKPSSKGSKGDLKRMEDARRKKEAKSVSAAEEERKWEQEKMENTKRKIDDLNRARGEIKQKIMEMEKNGRVDEGAYRKVEEIDRNIRELESSLR